MYLTWHIIAPLYYPAMSSYNIALNQNQRKCKVFFSSPGCFGSLKLPVLETYATDTAEKNTKISCKQLDRSESWQWVIESVLSLAMYLHLTQAHIHLSECDPKPLEPHLRLSMPTQNTEPLLKVRICFPGRYTPKPSLASSLGGQTWKVNHSAVSTWAQPRLLNLCCSPFLFPARVLVGWLSAQIVCQWLFWWESCFPFCSLFPLSSSPPRPPAAAGVETDTLPTDPSIFSVSSHSQLLCGRPGIYLLCFPAMPSSQVFVMATHPRPVTTFSFCSWWAVPWGMPHQHLPWHHQRGWAHRAFSSQPPANQEVHIW